MRNQYFMLYDGHPEPELGSPMEALDAAGAEVLGYSFRTAVQFKEVYGLLKSEYLHYRDLQEGFLPHVLSVFESCLSDLSLSDYKELSGSHRRFVQRFLCAANKPRPSTAVTTFFPDEWYRGDDKCMFYTFDAVVRQPMGDFSVGDQLCLVVEVPLYQGLRYMALDTFGRTVYGKVFWKVHLPGGSTLIDGWGFPSMFDYDDDAFVCNRILKLDLGREFGQGDPVRVWFQINKDLSGDLAIRNRPEVTPEVPLWLKVTLHSIVFWEDYGWVGRDTEEEWADDECPDNKSADDESADDESAEEDTAGD
ncbi:hypothetical protein HK104_002740 [Borealophlyctis nickersoniae]|nr:hypothetical protein HK104_002740 [Borealophlyctis nickersoniae]